MVTCLRLQAFAAGVRHRQAGLLASGLAAVQAPFPIRQRNAYGSVGGFDPALDGVPDTVAGAAPDSRAAMQHRTGFPFHLLLPVRGGAGTCLVELGWKRDKAYREYCVALTGAWRQVKTQPEQPRGVGSGLYGDHLRLLPPVLRGSSDEPRQILRPRAFR